MKTSTLFVFGAAVALGLSFAGCNCGGGGGGGDGGPDGGDGGETNCVAQGNACTPSGMVCCGANACDQTGTCQPTCGAPGASCTTGGECCFNTCQSNGQCAGACKVAGAACAAGSECCTQICNAGTDGGAGACGDIPGRPTTADGGELCKVRGEVCTSGGECCSTNCKGGICTPAYTCGAYNDICAQDTDCCSLKCQKASADAGVGYCYTVSGSGAPGCSVSGNPCSQGSQCCTFVCSDVGTGATVCQPVSGCQVAGEACVNNATCCGGAPNGSVTCRPAGPRCDQGTSCRDPGNICGLPRYWDGGFAMLPDGGQFRISSETNCCPGFPGADPVCHVDSSGVPRCYGGYSAGTCPFGYNPNDPACCVGTGGYCDFKDECCGGGACVVGADGGRQCQVATCKQVGADCGPADAGCCAGTQCLGTSELSFACQIPRPIPDGGTLPDGGVVDAGTCSANGAACSTASQCCSQICNGTCQAPVVCQPQGSACSVAGDCCSGLQCQVPVGGGGSTCQPGATCPAAGQACSPTNLCCNEGTQLQCVTGVGVACTGTTACSCQYIIGKIQP